MHRVTVVSIPRAFGIAPPKTVKTSSGPAADNSTFTSELQTAIEERKPGNKGTKQVIPADGGKPTNEKKKDDLAPVVAAPQPIVQPQPAGAFGLPAAGVDSGSKNEQASSDQPPPDTSALSVKLQAQTPLAESVDAGPKTKLAFALRLADLTPNQEALPGANSPIKPPPDAVQPDLKIPPVLTPEDPTAQRPVMAVKDTPQPPADSKLDLPVKTVQPATSVLVAEPPREGE